MKHCPRNHIFRCPLSQEVLDYNTSKLEQETSCHVLSLISSEFVITCGNIVLRDQFRVPQTFQLILCFFHVRLNECSEVTHLLDFTFFIEIKQVKCSKVYVYFKNFVIYLLFHLFDFYQNLRKSSSKKQ